MDSDGYLGSDWANAFHGALVHTSSSDSFIALIVAFVFLLVLAYLSASETAYFSLSPADAKTLDQQQHSSDSFALRLLDDPDRFFVTLFMARGLAVVAIVALCCFFFAELFSLASIVAEVVLQIVVLALVLLFLGEVIPRMLFARRPLTFIRFASPGLYVLVRLLTPLSSLLMRSAPQFSKRMARKGQHISVGELSQALDMSDGEDASEESTILEGIIRFGNESVKEIMTSRLDMVDLDIRSSFRDVMKCVVDNAYSRIPVYAGTRDNVKGVLYVKDLFPYVDKGDNFQWQSLVRTPYFVPETKMIDELLRDFQANKVHMAVVVDEFGCTSGLVTMEDIIEEIVGEIHDEYDEDERTYVKLDDHTWVFEGKTLLTDFCKITKIDGEVFDEVAGDADTVAGLLLEIKGEFPACHEKVSYRNYEFEVLDMDKRRILKVKFTILPPQPDEEKQDE